MSNASCESSMNIVSTSNDFSQWIDFDKSEGIGMVLGGISKFLNQNYWLKHYKGVFVILL